jgi:hypothetical protein
MKKTALSLLLALPLSSLALPSESLRFCIENNMILKHDDEKFPYLYEHLDKFDTLQDQAAKIDHLNAHLELLPYLRVQVWLENELQKNNVEVVQWLQQIMQNPDVSASEAAQYLLYTASKDNIEARLDVIAEAANKQPSLLYRIQVYRALRKSPFDLPKIKQFLQQIESNAKTIQWSIQARLLLDALPMPPEQLSKRLAAVFSSMPKEMSTEEALELPIIARLYYNHFKAGHPQAKQSLVLLAESESAFAVD